MAFSPTVIDDLLARTGRMCAVCQYRHGVQVHHIVPRHAGGSDDASNAIPLCPNCHSEVHASYAPGRTTRIYSEQELRGHLQRTIELAARRANLVPANADWNRDVELIKFYASCLDRPAFRTHFHNELSFADFDQALEDVSLALNTGLLRTRDGMLIEKAAGRRSLVNAEWREKVDGVIGAIQAARDALRRDLGLDQMLMTYGPGHHWLDRHASALRSNHALAADIDQHRQQALDSMNEILTALDLPPLKRIGDYS